VTLEKHFECQNNENRRTERASYHRDWSEMKWNVGLELGIGEERNVRQKMGMGMQTREATK
jgi:hypothetical protein